MPPDFWWTGGWPAALLAPVGRTVARAARRRARARTPVDPGMPVVCAGNLVVGGAGKTPVALDLGRRLRDRGRRVHFLTRGYGGRARRTPLRVDPANHDAGTVGDEALLLAEIAPTWVAPDRVAGARAAVAEGAAVLVLDDGFQAPRLAFDLALLVVDGEVGFGNGRVLPAGPLREDATAALARADAVVRLGPDRTGLGTRLPAGMPVVSGRIAPTGDTAWLRGAKVLAFAGIARPGKLFHTLRAAGAELVGTVAFADHHRYSRRECDDLLAWAEAAAAYLVTTTKDRVRLPPAMRARTVALPVGVAWDAPEALNHLLDRLPRDAHEHG